MRSLFVIISIIISALAYGQDLLPKQAPYDRKSKPLTSISSSENSVSKTTSSDEKIKDVDKLVESEESNNKNNSKSSSNFNIQFYKVKNGDTLPSIARKVHTTVDKLCKLNSINKTTKLKTGQILKYH